MHEIQNIKGKLRSNVFTQTVAVTAIHTTLQASHYLPVQERQTFNEEFLSAAHFVHL